MSGSWLYCIVVIIVLLIGAPGDIQNIQTLPRFQSISVSWEVLSDTGCSVVYQIKAFPVFTNDIIFSFNETGNSFTLSNLDPDSLYMISLHAVNDLGVSNYSNFTVRTTAIGN